MKVLLRPSTLLDAKERDPDTVKIQKKSKPTAAQVVANSLKQHQELEDSAKNPPKVPAADSKSNSQNLDKSTVTAVTTALHLLVHTGRGSTASAHPACDLPAEVTGRRIFNGVNPPAAATGMLAAMIGARSANRNPAARIAAPGNYP